MRQEDTLAGLMLKASDQGADVFTLKAIVEETSELAANRVLDRLGLADAGAEGDLGWLSGELLEISPGGEANGE